MINRRAPEPDTGDMGRPFLFILIFNILVTIGGYTVMFGESGFLVRRTLRQELTNLRAGMEELKQEQELLQEQYLMLHSNNTMVDPEEQEILDATILKFDESPGFYSKPKSSGESSSALTSLSLKEARILFFILMGVWSILTLYASFPRDFRQILLRNR